MQLLAKHAHFGLVFLNYADCRRCGTPKRFRFGRASQLPYLTSLNLAVANGTLAKPFIWDPVLEVLAERGALHEQDYVDHLKASGLSVTAVDGLGVDFKCRNANARGDEGRSANHRAGRSSSCSLERTCGYPSARGEAKSPRILVI